MILLPYIDGLCRSREKQEETAVFICSKCGSRRTVKAGKTIPKCSKCNEQTYWSKKPDFIP